MRIHEIESWAVRIINQVQSKHPVEDFLVELKATWITPSKAARRLAGHANAAQGEPILWLVGADQNQGIVGTNYEELTEWWAQVQAEFDGVAPTLTDLNIYWDSQTIVALFFQTERAPFVVRNPKYGQPDGGAVEREVPWRDGTSTRTAKRNDLLTILSPLQRVPHYELLRGELSAYPIKYDKDEQSYSHWRLKFSLYMYPQSDLPIVIPSHRCEASFEIAGFLSETSFYQVNLPVHGKTMITEQMGSGEIIDGPGLLILEAHKDMMPIEKVTLSDARIKIKLQIADTNKSILVEELLPMSRPTGVEIARWALNNYPKGERKGHAYRSVEEF